VPDCLESRSAAAGLLEPECRTAGEPECCSWTAGAGVPDCWSSGGLEALERALESGGAAAAALERAAGEGCWRRWRGLLERAAGGAGEGCWRGLLEALRWRGLLERALERAAGGGGGAGAVERGLLEAAAALESGERQLEAAATL
jgi:hypothetical protein